MDIKNTFSALLSAKIQVYVISSEMAKVLT